MEKRDLFLQKKLTDSGFRLTKPRRSILKTLSRTREHLSAEDIYREVSRDYPAIGLTTVYRTLELFVRMGMVQKYEFGDGRSRYEIVVDTPRVDEHHHHLICTKCHRVIDYTDFIEQEKDLLKETEEGLSRLYNFEIRSHTIAFYGLCENCR